MITSLKTNDVPTTALSPHTPTSLCIDIYRTETIIDHGLVYGLATLRVKGSSL